MYSLSVLIGSLGPNATRTDSSSRTAVALSLRKYLGNLFFVKYQFSLSGWGTLCCPLPSLLAHHSPSAAALELPLLGSCVFVPENLATAFAYLLCRAFHVADEILNLQPVGNTLLDGIVSVQ